MKDAFILGTRVYLRPHVEEDIQRWSAWFNDQEVTRFLQHGRFPNTFEHQRQRLASLYREPSNIQLAIVARETDCLVGTVGLHDIDYVNRNADVSIVIGEREHQGKGLSKDAVGLLVRHGFVRLNLHKITAGMVDVNVASSRLFTTMGFQAEGVLREHIYVDGAYRDVTRMAAFRRSWALIE